MDKAAVEKCLKRLLAREEPGDLTPRGPWDARLQEDIERLETADPASKSVKSALLLWNDDLPGSHAIAQELPDEFGAYLHGVMHRREPDPSNSKYWFRRVGDHPLFPQLRSAVLELGPAEGPELRKILDEVRDARAWDAFRMVDWCDSARREETVAFLRAAQAIEIQGLTYFWLDRARIPRP